MKVRERVAYAMEQPFCKSVEPVGYEHLWNDETTLAAFLDVIRKGEEARREHKRGADLLGGGTIWDAAKTLIPFKKRVRSKLYNLFVATNDLTLFRDMPELGKKEGEVLAKKGEIRMYDLRFFDLGSVVDRFIDNIQFTTLWAVAETLGIEPEMEFDTLTRKAIRWFVRRGLRKVWQAAEPDILPWKHEEPHLLAE